jgi:hypothetical protein
MSSRVAAHLAGAEAVDRQQHQHRVIADLHGSITAISVEELLDLAPPRTLWQPLMRVQPRRIDRLGQPRTDPAAHRRVSEETS